MLEERARLFGDLTYRAAIFDDMDARIAIINAMGDIVSVNERWQESESNGIRDGGSRNVGRNYFALCRETIDENDVRVASAGTREVMEGTREYFYHECSVPQPDAAERWLALRVTPLIDRPNLYAVAHEDITERVSRERNRLRALVRSGLLHAIPAGEFDHLVEKAKTTLAMPMSTFSLLDERKVVFFSCAGCSLVELARASSFCAVTITDDQPLVVGDALKDPRFDRSALVVREPKVRFYAGIPVHLSTGEAVGSLCVIDIYPRSFSQNDLAVLQQIADQIEHRLHELERS